MLSIISATETEKAKEVNLHICNNYLGILPTELNRQGYTLDNLSMNWWIFKSFSKERIHLLPCFASIIFFMLIQQKGSWRTVKLHLWQICLVFEFQLWDVVAFRRGRQATGLSDCGISSTSLWDTRCVHHILDSCPKIRLSRFLQFMHIVYVYF